MNKKSKRDSGGSQTKRFRASQTENVVIGADFNGHDDEGNRGDKELLLVSRTALKDRRWQTLPKG